MYTLGHSPPVHTHTHTDSVVPYTQVLVPLFKALLSVLFNCMCLCQWCPLPPLSLHGYPLTQSWLWATCHSDSVILFSLYSSLSPHSLSPSHSRSSPLNICDTSPSTCLWIRGYDWQTLLHDDSRSWALRERRGIGARGWEGERQRAKDGPNEWVNEWRQDLMWSIQFTRC